MEESHNPQCGGRGRGLPGALAVFLRVSSIRAVGLSRDGQSSGPHEVLLPRLEGQLKNKHTQ